MSKKALRKDFYMESEKVWDDFCRFSLSSQSELHFSQESDLRSRICDCQEMHILMRKILWICK